MKTQTRIAAVFFLFSLIIIFFLSGSVYYFQTKYSYTDFYKRLEIRAAVAARTAFEKEENTALREVREMHLEKLPGEKEYFFEFNPAAGYEKEAAEIGVDADFFSTLIREGTATYRAGNLFYAGIKHRYQGGETLVVVSAENYYYTHHLNYLGKILLIVILLSSLFALPAALFLSRRVLRSVKEITFRVKEISSRSLHLRLDASLEKDEIGELVSTFNTMLDRLETAFETQNNFISNASHELSTPLTAIIGETDVALSKERSVQEYVDALKAVQTEAERLESITRSLLFLAQTGFRGEKQPMNLLRADQLLWDVKETIERMNPQSNIVLQLHMMPESPEKLKVWGNEQLLHLALVNIVNNACKYSSNKQVSIAIGTSEMDVIIVVKDQGIGIPAEELRYIYDPFFRASNTGTYEGYGIGLPLSRNIIRLHKGELLISSEINLGTTVQVNLPVRRIYPV